MQHVVRRKLQVIQTVCPNLISCRACFLESLFLAGSVWTLQSRALTFNQISTSNTFFYLLTHAI